MLKFRGIGPKLAPPVSIEPKVLAKPIFLPEFQIFHVHLVLVFEVIVDTVPGIKLDVVEEAEEKIGARTPKAMAEGRKTEVETCQTEAKKDESIVHPKTEELRRDSEISTRSRPLTRRRRPQLGPVSASRAVETDILLSIVPKISKTRVILWVRIPIFLEAH